MLRTQLAFLALLPALALGWGACTGETDSGDDAVAEEGAAMVAPRPGLFGTFRGKPTALGGLTMLVLKSDGTYHRARLFVSETAPYAPADDGIYQITVRGGATMMTLYPNASDVVDRYQYVLAGDTLRVWPVDMRAWTTLKRTPDAAWCDVPRDCDLQNLPVGVCAGTWNCGGNVCDYTCGYPM